MTTSTCGRVFPGCRSSPSTRRKAEERVHVLSESLSDAPRSNTHERCVAVATVRLLKLLSYMKRIVSTISPYYWAKTAVKVNEANVPPAW